MELYHAKLATYMAIQFIELKHIGAGVGGSIKHTSKLKVLNFKKAMQSPDVEKWCKKIGNKKVHFDQYNSLMPL